MVSNRFKDANRHSADGAAGDTRIEGNGTTVINDGASPRDERHIFERFYQGSHKEGSTGLGLALVKAITD
jgi:Signal transduction histidine kinase